MKTYQAEIKELNKEVKALERKELDIRIGYKFKRKSNGTCVKILDYDEKYVHIKDEQHTKDTDFTHFVPRYKFTTDYFRR